MLDQTPGPDIAGQPAIIQQSSPRPSLAINRVLSRFDRTDLEGFISIAIDLLDLADGDPEVEDDDSEESFALPREALASAGGPGCPIADAGGDIANEDVAGGYLDAAPSGPGCPISDPDIGADDIACDDINDDREEELIGECADAEARAIHLRRIRRTRCYPQYRRYRDWKSRDMRTEVMSHRLLFSPNVPTRRQLLRRKRGVPRRPRA